MFSPSCGSFTFTGRSKVSPGETTVSGRLTISCATAGDLTARRITLFIQATMRKHLNLSVFNRTYYHYSFLFQAALPEKHHLLYFFKHLISYFSLKPIQVDTASDSFTGGAYSIPLDAVESGIDATGYERNNLPSR